MAQFYHTRETNILDGDLSITILYTHMYTQTHIYTVCVTDSPPSYIYIDIYTLFHHTELTSVSPHTWPSVTTLGKPTIWMVTYLSPSHTPICTHIYTNILLVLQIVHHHTSIFTYLYTLFHHTELSICFTAQIDHHHVYIYIYSVSPHRVNICLPHRWHSFTTLGKPTI